MKYLWIAALGNLAAALWFIPPLCKALYKLNGVQFEDARSVFISKFVTIDNCYPESVSIGRDVWLTQGVRVTAHSASSLYQQQHFGMKVKVAPVKIEQGVFIGMNSVILPGVVLGEGCYIGAGSVVNRSIAPGMLAVGNPCREIRRLTPADRRS